VIWARRLAEPHAAGAVASAEQGEDQPGSALEI